MKVTFLLPGSAAKPMGGYKVVYEYAGQLAARGHEITVVHAAYLPEGSRGYRRTFRSKVLSYAVKGGLGIWRPDRWFTVDPRVRLMWVACLQPESVPDADAIVATWWLTAEILSRWPDRKGRKFYLIQHLETWGGPEDRVLATWRLPLRKIVIARWLQQFAQQLGEECHYIPNGLDFTAFGIDTNPAERFPGRVAMLCHKQDWKGSGEGIEALRLAKSKVSGLRVELFGVDRSPGGLPSWISYYRNPRQSQLRAIYNRAAIFVSPSWVEGWPLPPAEALMCGCALVCTDIGGHREYATPEVTALMGAPKNPAGLARNIERLATNHSFRMRLSTQGNRNIQQYTWQRATDGLEAALTGCCACIHSSDETTPACHGHAGTHSSEHELGVSRQRCRSGGSDIQPAAQHFN